MEPGRHFRSVALDLLPEWGNLSAADVFEGATELCDGFDNNCDARVDWSTTPFDEGIPLFLDRDGDGFGSDVVYGCGEDEAAQIVLEGHDCDDNQRNVFPGAPEICGDAVRQDCRLELSIYDCDGDHVEGVYASNPGGTDCDDTRAAVHPGVAVELCDGFDNDCDGLVDSEDSDNLESNTPYWYEDADLDGVGVLSTGIQQCDPPGLGYSLIFGDCDDADPTNYPAAPWYLDTDGDGYGDIQTSTVASCDPPDAQGHWTHIGGDCADNDPTINPGTEWLLDMDGDGLGDPQTAAYFCAPDEDDERPWVRPIIGVDCDDADIDVQGSIRMYPDDDRDGYGDTDRPDFVCSTEPGYVVVDGDCDDSSPAVHPGADELCNFQDDDCDGLVDADDPELDGSGLTGYPDFDGDGFGSGEPRRLCLDVPQGWSLEQGDCDDHNPSIFPGQREECGNGVDDDCDGVTDQEPSWYVDHDGDGYGTGHVVTTDCLPPSSTGYATNHSDCDDTTGSVHPGAPERETCDGIDDNCDGVEEPQFHWVFDADGDGLGADATEQLSCAEPTDPPTPGATGSWVLDGGDCDDTDPNVTFGGLWYEDADGDGLGDASRSVVACAQLDDQGQNLSVWLYDDVDGDGAFDPGDGQRAVSAGDCADTNASIGLPRLYYFDVDGDGWGDTTEAALAHCPDSLGNAPGGFSGRTGDCADTDPHIYPGAPEQNADGIDSDCDGFDDANMAILFYPDADGDGAGAWDAVGTTTGVAGMVANNLDCDDSDPDIRGGRIVYTDADLDTFGSGPPVFLARCELMAGESLVGTDCDDTDAAISPAAVELACDGIDNRCTGLADDEADLDQDGQAACEGDCDDSEPAKSSLAMEVCDGVLDNDCDPTTQDPDSFDGDGDGFALCDDPDDSDINIPAQRLWYPDDDGDGYGSDRAVGVFATSQPPNMVADNTDCRDRDVYTNPGIAVEYCDGVDNNCDGAHDADGSPDVPNPFLGTVVADVGFEFYADLDRNGVQSVDSLLHTCVDYGTGTTLTYADGTELQVKPFSIALTDCDDGSDREGTLYMRDADGDGVPAMSSSNDVFLDECGSGTIPSGFVRVTSGHLDCAPDDPGLMVVSRGQFVDADGDGYFTPYQVEAGVCVAAVSTEAGRDCNDAEYSRRPEIADTTVVVTYKEQLNALASVCRDATLLLDFTRDLDLNVRPQEGANLTFVGTTFDDCDASHTTGCLHLDAGIWGEWTAEFRDIGLTGEIHPDGTSSFVNTRWSAVDSRFGRTVSIEDTTIYLGNTTGVDIAPRGSASLARVFFDGRAQPGDAYAINASEAVIDLTDVEIVGAKTALDLFQTTATASGLVIVEPRVGISLAGSVATFADVTITDQNYTGESMLSVDGGSSFDCLRCELTQVVPDGPDDYMVLDGEAVFTDLVSDLQVSAFGLVTPTGKLTVEGADVTLTTMLFLRVDGGEAILNGVDMVSEIRKTLDVDSGGAMVVSGLTYVSSSGDGVVFDIAGGSTLDAVGVDVENAGMLLEAWDAAVQLRDVTFEGSGREVGIYLERSSADLEDLLITGGVNSALVLDHSSAVVKNLEVTASGGTVGVKSGSDLFLEDSLLSPTSNVGQSMIVDSDAFASLDRVRIFHTDPLYPAMQVGGIVDINHSLLWTEQRVPLLHVSTAGGDPQVSVRATTLRSQGTEVMTIDDLLNPVDAVVMDKMLFHIPGSVLADPLVHCGIISGVVSATDSWSTAPDPYTACPGILTSNPADAFTTGLPAFNSFYYPTNPIVRANYGELAN